MYLVFNHDVFSFLWKLKKKKLSTGVVHNRNIRKYLKYLKMFGVFVNVLKSISLTNKLPFTCHETKIRRLKENFTPYLLPHSLLNLVFN